MNRTEPTDALIDTELTQLQEARAELASETIFEKPCLVFRFNKDGVQIALPTPLRIDSPIYFAHSTQSSFKALTDRHPNEWRAARGIVQQLASEMYQSMNKKELGASEEEAPKSAAKDPASDLNEERLNSQSRP